MLQVRFFPFAPISKLKNFLADAVELHKDPHLMHSQDQQLSYAGAIIGSLQRALQRECEAHSKTRSKVRILEAQIARRDAELEKYVQNGPTPPAQPPGETELKRPVEALDSGQISSLLQQTLANNKVLELEVQNLARKVGLFAASNRYP